MIHIRHFYRRQKLLLGLFLAASFLLFLSSCDNAKTGERGTPKAASAIPLIENEKEFAHIIDSSGDRLLMLDLYADWCAPCRELSPILEEIAEENKDRVAVYKIDVDANRAIASALRMTRIPYVVFIQNKKILHTMLGLHPKRTYVSVIKHFSK